MLSRRIGVALLAVVLVIIPLLSFAAVPSATVSYLQARSQQDAWVVMALRSAGQSVSADALGVDTLTSATDIERTILGVVAGHGNPYQFKNTDLVAMLDGLRNNNQLGEERLLNDDIFGVLAYVASGVSGNDARVADSRAKIVHHQNTDGGWGYAVGATSDSNITAMATMALLRSGSTANDTPVSKALVYLRSVQQVDGGFAIFAGQMSDTASTSWVISAVQTAGMDPRAWVYNGLHGFDYLNSTQRSDGSYAWKASDSTGSSIMTAYAAIAQAGTGYPVAYYSAPVVVDPAPVAAPTPTPVVSSGPVYLSTTGTVSFRVEGATEQLCQGQANAATALQVLEIAATQCNFTYELRETGMGAYVASVAGQSAQEEKGWLYRVNWRQPEVGAQAYAVANGDYVTWYFGRFDAKNLRVKVINVQQIPSGARVHVLAESETNGVFEPVAHVSLYTNQYHSETNEEGISMFTLPPGDYRISGMLEHHIRSHASTLIVR